MCCSVIQVQGTVQLVFEKESKNAYVRQFKIADSTITSIRDGSPKGTDIIDRLIKFCLKKAESYYGAEFIAIGIRDEEQKKMVDSLGYLRSYQTVVMKLADAKVQYGTLELEPLSEKNLEEYMNTFNESFDLIPNGGTITFEEVLEYLTRETEEYFLVKDTTGTIGILELFPKSEEDHFVIGLSPMYQGKGYGKLLLETAIDELLKRGISEIYMDVITLRQRALEMYQKRGFKIVKVYTQWYTV